MDTTTQIFNFISNNYGTLTGIGVSIWGLVKTNVFPLIKEYIQEKNNIIKDDKTKALVTDAEDKVENLLVESMSAIEKTTKEELVSKIESGELNKDSLSTLPSIVIEKVKNQLSDKYKDALKSEFGNFEDYLATKLQYLYDKYKNDNTSVIGTVKVSDIASIVTKSADALTSSDITALQTQLTQTQTEKDTITQQLAQVQADKESVSQQLSQLQNDKANVDLVNTNLQSQLNDSQLQVTSLSQQVQDLTNKLNTINSALSGVSASPVVDNTVQSTQAVDTTIVTNPATATDTNVVVNQIV